MQNKRRNVEVYDMTQKMSRVLWIIAGAVLMIAGVICLLSPAAALAGLSFFLGTAMLVSGIVDLLIFALCYRSVAGAGWFLVDGILTVLLSMFVLCDQWFTALTIPFIFGMWLLCTGVSKVANSFELRRLGIRGWGWFTAIGSLMTAAGFFSFLDPLSGIAAISAVSGCFLILEGLASILRGCFAFRFWL